VEQLSKRSQSVLAARLTIRPIASRLSGPSEEQVGPFVGAVVFLAQDVSQIDFPGTPALIGDMDRPAGGIASASVRVDVQVDPATEVHDQGRKQRLEFAAVAALLDWEVQVHPDAVVTAGSAAQ